jgi:hypothetical protein
VTPPFRIVGSGQGKAVTAVGMVPVVERVREGPIQVRQRHAEKDLSFAPVRP